MTDEARGHLAMLVFSALIAGSFSLGSLAAPFIEPAALNVARFALAALVVAGMAMVTGRFRPAALRAPWRYVILGGLFAIYFLTMYEALKTVPAVSTAAVFTLTPFLAACLGWAILGQRLNLPEAGALAIGAVGALFVIFRGDWAAFTAFDIGRGELIFFFGCLAHALYPTATRALTRGEPALMVNFGMLLAGFVVLLAYGWSDIRATDWAGLPPVVWVTIVYTAVFAGATTFTLLQYASVRLPAGKVMAYTYLVPGWVIAWQLALGQPTAPPRALLGVLLIGLALGLLLRGTVTRADRKVPAPGSARTPPD